MLSRYCFISVSPLRCCQNRSLGWLIRCNKYAGCRCFAIDKVKCSRRATVCKKPPPCAKNERVDEQNESVNQILLHQRPDEFTAAHNQEIGSKLLLELSHGIGSISTKQRRVAPRKRLGQCRRGDVLLRVVESCRKGIICLFGPERKEILIGLSSQKERAVLGLAHHRRTDGFTTGSCPTPVCKAIASVFVGATR